MFRKICGMNKMDDGDLKGSSGLGLCWYLASQEVNVPLGMLGVMSSMALLHS